MEETLYTQLCIQSRGIEKGSSYREYRVKQEPLWRYMMHPKTTKPEMDWDVLCNARKDWDDRAASK